MATATARLSSTTGEGSARASRSYSPTIRAQSVASAVVASAWAAAIAAWRLYGPTCPDATARSSRAAPSAIRARSQRERSWSASRTRSPPAEVRAARRESWSSISASRPSASGSGPGRSSTSSRPRRIASSASSGRTTAPPDAGAYPSVKTR